MKKINKLIYIIRNLKDKLRVGITDTKTSSEVWHTFISPLGVLWRMLVVVVLVVVALFLGLSYSSFMDLMPGYPGKHSRELLLENIMRLDSLERQLNSVQRYSDNVTRIMNGELPIEEHIDSSDSLLKQNKLVTTSAQDSILRRELEGEGVYKLNSTSRERILLIQEFLSPALGEIVEKFDTKESPYGIKLKTSDNKQVMAIDEGTVILTTWSPVEGNVVQIQHNNNIISVYKQLFTVIKKQGDVLRSGEVIGFTSDDEQNDSFIFELWSNGKALDPENFILFQL